MATGIVGFGFAMMILLAGAGVPAGEWSQNEWMTLAEPWDQRTTGFPGPSAAASTHPRIGPGEPILVTKPGVQGSQCTAGFLWRAGDTYFLSTAGHCLLPPDRQATHGQGADYDASGVTVSIEGVALGPVRYARQGNSTQVAAIGNDFGLVEIPPELVPPLSFDVPMWGGPTQSTPITPSLSTVYCHYGQGAIYRNTEQTKARIGTYSPISGTDYWAGELFTNAGDSGSPVVSCVADGTDLHGWAPIGILTHGGAEVVTRVPAPGALGTTIDKARQMAREAGLEIELVISQ